MIRNKRADVPISRKFEYLAMALKEISIRPNAKRKTDAIGLACQFSTCPKLRRKDFYVLEQMTINQILHGVEHGYKHFI